MQEYEIIFKNHFWNVRMEKEKEPRTGGTNRKQIIW